ncbi:type II toxin-antitoxin system death-on-curing family toxin [Staphylococcus simulans]|uniref:type II toxin-antitoxin system death-on-curing family toxin n=1 Tax=Staphylococcus simulans TaxID=1286 RepID=UPI0039995E56
MIKYLTERQIVAINHKIILETTPTEQIGIKDPYALNMIVGLLKQDVFGRELYPDLLLKAARLYELIIKKHIFLNGNKRTAFTCLEIFLFINGKTIAVPTQEGIDFTCAILTENLDRKTIERWIEYHILN